MKIMFFIPRFACGGAERVMCTVALRLGAEKLHDVSMLVNRNDGELKSLTDGNISVHSLGGARLWRSLLPLLRYIKKEKPDVVIATLPGPVWLSFLAVKIARLRVRFIARQANMVGVAYVTDESRGSLIKRLGDRLLRFPLRGADAAIAVSDDVDRSLQSVGVPSSRIYKIPNPVDTVSLSESSTCPCTHAWLRSDRGTKCIVSAGRLAHQKGYDRLIRALGIANEEDDCRAIILGDGPLRADLEEQVSDARLTGRVDMPGIVDNPAAYFARADAFVLPSRWEGMPNVLLEAAASGAPLIATDCPGGSREILEALDGGRLVPPDSPEAMASAILDCVRQPEAFRVDPELVREIYGIDEIVDQYLRVIVGVGLA